MSDMINIALPKGRLGDKVYGMLAKAGYECPALLEDNRKLVFENAETGVRYCAAYYLTLACTGRAGDNRDVLCKEGGCCKSLLRIEWSCISHDHFVQDLLRCGPDQV